MGYFLYHFLETVKWPFPILVSTLSNLFQRCNEFIGQGVEPPQFHPHQLSRKMQRIHATCTKRMYPMYPIHAQKNSGYTSLSLSEIWSARTQQ